MPDAYADLGFSPDNPHDDLGFMPDKPAKPMRPPVSEFESALRGAAQGATFGMADELAGAGGAIKDVATDPNYKIQDLLNRYRANREESRGNFENARQDNPKSFTGGELAGGLASSLIPGLGAGEGMLGAIKAGGALGALQGFGTSDADLTKGDVGAAAKDTAKGAALGGALGGAGHAVADTIRGFTPTNIAKKLSNVFLNTPEEATEAYIANPEAVRNAPTRFELSQDLLDKVGSLKNDVINGSEASRQILRDEGQKVSGNDIASLFTKRADDIKARAEGVMEDPQLASYNWLKDYANKFGSPSLPEGVQGPVPNAPDFSTNRVKDLIQNIRQSTNFETAPGKFTPLDDRIKMGAQSDVDALLKQISPAYASQMKNVASDASLLDNVSNIAKSPQGLANALRRVTTDQYGAGQAPRDALEQFGQRMGTDYLEQARNALAKETFDKPRINGSRVVQTYSNALKNVPVLGKLAPLFGATVDKYGGEMTMGAVDLASKLNSLYSNGNIQQFVQEAQPLLQAAQQGSPAAALTFHLLNKSNPEALKHLQDNK